MIRRASPSSLSTLCVVCSAKSSQASALINRPTLLGRSVTPSLAFGSHGVDSHSYEDLGCNEIGAAKRDVCRSGPAVSNLKRRLRLPQLKWARGAKDRVPQLFGSDRPENSNI